ncbi:MAG: hypothetical protein M3081_00720 [Gemmatimonadota bacterium]|nr:hypothetical protein [Gemmatimonadota bacterium]
MQREIRLNDDAGISWRICEVRSGDPKPRKGVRVDPKNEHTRHRGLYFFSRYETKRLVDFPADWSSLTPKELTALCEGAESLRNVEAMTDERAVPASEIARRP